MRRARKFLVPILMVLSLTLLTGSDIECEFDGFPGWSVIGYPYYDYVVYDYWYDPFWW